MDPEKRVIQSNQDMHVCGIYMEWMYVVDVAINGVNGGKGESMVEPNSTLLLESISLF
jgi:hypothetical protein